MPLAKESRNGIRIPQLSAAFHEMRLFSIVNYACTSFENKCMSSYFPLVSIGHCYGVVGFKKKLYGDHLFRERTRFVLHILIDAVLENSRSGN